MNAEWAQALAFHEKRSQDKLLSQIFHDSKSKIELEKKEVPKSVSMRDDLRLPDFALKRLTKKVY